MTNYDLLIQESGLSEEEAQSFAWTKYKEKHPEAHRWETLPSELKEKLVIDTCLEWRDL